MLKAQVWGLAFRIDVQLGTVVLMEAAIQIFLLPLLLLLLLEDLVLISQLTVSRMPTSAQMLSTVLSWNKTVVVPVDSAVDNVSSGFLI